MRDTGRIEEAAEKTLSIGALVLSIDLVLFKFLPDIGTAFVQHTTSALTDFSTYRRDYFTPDSVHSARFLGNHILFRVASLVERVYHSPDVRLHPIRIAAGLLTPIYAYIGLHAVLRDDTYRWRRFLAAYALAVLMGLYAFYPGDMPALASLSISLYFILERRPAAALAFMLLTGLFRESSFHSVWFILAWALSDSAMGRGRRVAWVGAFTIAFTLEYLIIRHFFPGPVSSAVGGISLNPREIFLGNGLVSLTTLCSLGLAALYPLAGAVVLGGTPALDWRRRFFALNYWIFPAWIIFYRMLNGNISEFRLLWAAILPCMYGIAYAGTGTPARSGASA